MDESTFGIAPVIRRGWAKRGSKPVALISHTRDCFHAFGARTRKRFVFSFAKRQTHRTFLRFIDQLLRRWPRLLLFLDNAPWHKGKRIKAFCKAHRKTLRLAYFPAYSPELNPVEQCWKAGKAAIANRAFTRLANLRYRLIQTFKQEKAMPKYFEYLCP